MGLSTIESDRKGVCKDVYEIASFKNEVALLYFIGIFQQAVKPALPNRKTPHLRNVA